MIENKTLISGHHERVSDNPDPSSSSNSSLPPSPLRSHNIPISSIPNDVSFTLDQIRRGFGFRNIDRCIKQIQKNSLPNYFISTTDYEPVTDLGTIATIDKANRNKTPLTLPTAFGDTVHMDILYGANTAHGGIKYALYIVDRATRYKYIHPMKNLSSDILDGIKSYCNDMKTVPKRFISDRDCRLFSEDVITWLREKNSHIHAAPEGKQNQNGLAEGTRRTILRMARGWIASSLLPPTYWWFAFKRAVEVSNYLPLKLNNKYTTPHELVYQERPNLQNLLPLISVCYIRRKTNHDNTKLKNIESHSIAVILVGRSSVCNSPVFFHPHTKKLITTDD